MFLFKQVCIFCILYTLGPSSKILTKTTWQVWTFLESCQQVCRMWLFRQPLLICMPRDNILNLHEWIWLKGDLPQWTNQNICISYGIVPSTITVLKVTVSQWSLKSFIEWSIWPPIPRFSNKFYYFYFFYNFSKTIFAIFWNSKPNLNQKHGTGN